VQANTARIPAAIFAAMYLEAELRRIIAEAAEELYGFSPEPSLIRLEKTNPDFRGDYTLVVFPLVKVLKQAPDKLAMALGENLSEKSNLIAGFNVIKGFLNLELPEEYWVEFLRETWNNGDFGRNSQGKGTRIMVEYSSPNTNKPLHLGHIRNNLLGWSVAEILKANGYDVIKANLINDRGIHICKSMLAWQKYGQGETPESSGLKGDHLAGKYYVEFDRQYRKQVAELIEGGMPEAQAEKEAPLIQETQEMLRQWEAGNESVIALWNQMNDWVYAGFKVTYEKLGVDFDRYYYESNTYKLGKDLIAEGLEKGVFFRKPDGSVWIDLSQEGLDEKLVMRSDGTSVYITQDIGTAQLKYDDYAIQRSIYVVGNEQDYHFKVLKLIMQKLGKPYADGIYHLSYGMVDLPEGKMKSREGTVVDADDLIREMEETARLKTEELGKTEGMDADELQALYSLLGLAALKFFILKVDPLKRMLFNPKESIDFQGDTGPFIQYTYARIRSMLRNLRDVPVFPAGAHKMHTLEKEVICALHMLPDVVAEAGRNYDPSPLAQWCLHTARSFNRLYNELPVLKESDENTRAFRLCLAAAVANSLKNGLGLLGIGAPEKM
jgi:arginyl-tRNA synthetase